MMPAIGFAQPLILLALVALPLLWWLLRAVPPAPIRRRFPAVALLLGLRDADVETDRTPWWLMALRMLAVAAAIIAFAGPVLNPRPVADDRGPLLIVMDATWADAPDWPRRLAELRQVVEGAGRAGRPVALLAGPDAPVFQTADAVLPRLSGLTPAPWTPDYTAWADALPDAPFATLWMSDGLDHAGRAEFLTALEARGDVRVMEVPDTTLALRPARVEGDKLIVPAARLPVMRATEAVVLALGPDPSGADTLLGRAPLTFAAEETEATARLTLPPELRNRITRFQIEGVRSAGAVTLADDALRRREVALIPTGPRTEGADVLSPLFYVRQALAPQADLIEVPLAQALPANPDVIVLTEAAPADPAALVDWVQRGGLLLRFAGPRLADAAPVPDDPLLPVPLRTGGREMGGALSWGEPRRLAPFPENSPFHGLPVPEEVTVTRQVLAQPGPDLADRTLAALEDGTPFVTRRTLGQGQVVLIHATANADWSNLPLSGLFPAMLARLTLGAGTGEPEDLAGRIWSPEQALDAFGRLSPAPALSGVEGEALATAPPSATMPPGVYADGPARVALNILRADTPLEAAVWPDGQVVEGLAPTSERSLKGAALTVALLALMVDVIAALSVSGRLARGVGVLALILLPVAESRADPVADTQVLRLAHVLTGDARVDDLAGQGLSGLSRRLSERTTVEPGDPVGLNVESDELAFYPLLYWPVVADAPTPSANALARLNDFLRTGGMILFDTRDGDVAGSGTTPEAQALQRIAAGLDIPPLEQVPEDHVLTRTFYLLQDFPGRYTNRALWVEAAPDPGAVEEGQPFRHLNDGVTPVVIGGNDWAAAWAVDATGFPALPVGRGFGGERQREIAVRFGINLVIHVLTGNYKNDQIHVPALLERLGN